MPQQSGTIKAIAYRPTDGDAMQEVTECRVLMARGLDSENRKPGKREVTLLSADAWTDVCRDLGAELPWLTRRANLLVEGMDLSETIARTLTIGEVGLLIHGESKPCAMMDKQHAGLRAALKPDSRGGVFGQVLAPGIIRVGDSVTVFLPHT